MRQQHWERKLTSDPDAAVGMDDRLRARAIQNHVGPIHHFHGTIRVTEPACVAISNKTGKPVHGVKWLLS